MEHTHYFSRFFLSDRGKFWNPLVIVGEIGAWYVGYECECGEVGYEVP